MIGKSAVGVNGDRKSVLLIQCQIYNEMYLNYALYNKISTENDGVTSTAVSQHLYKWEACKNNYVFTCYLIDIKNKQINSQSMT